MKPEVRIALVKETERTKIILSEEYSIRWTKYGYIGAILNTFVGCMLLESTISYIAKQSDNILSIVFLFGSLIFTLAPWYFLLRREMNRKIQLLGEGVLSVSEQANDNG